MSLELKDKDDNGLHMSIPRELAGRICKKLQAELDAGGSADDN